MSKRIKGQLTTDGNELITMKGLPVGTVSIVGKTYETDQRTAQRLAACWNACESLSDDELSEGVVSVKKLREMFQDHMEDSSMFGNGPLALVSSECNKKVRGLFEAITGKELPQ